MDIFWKITAAILTAVILWINISKSNKDISVLMSLGVSAMAVIAAASLLQPVVSFVNKLQGISNLDGDLVSVIMKVVGIGIVSELAMVICKDAGNEAMGKTLQFVSAMSALLVSMPVFEKLLTLLDKILGTI